MQFETIEHREFVLDLLEHGTATELREFIHQLHNADLAIVLESLPPDERHRVWNELAQSDMGDVLAKVSDGVRDGLIRDTDPHIFVTAIQSLDIDDIVEMMPDLSPDLVAELMLGVDEKRRNDLSTLLSYDEDTAGRLMDVDTVTVRERVTIRTVMRYLRMRGELPEHTDKLYVVNRSGVLRGAIQIRLLVTSGLDDLVSEHMNENTVTFNPEVSVEEVADAFQKYDLGSAPVVDQSGRLMGRITIDDVVDVIQDSAEQLFLAHAGLHEDEDVFAPVLYTAKRRALWLGVNLITAVIASIVIGQFEDTIEKLVALAVLMPIIASMGGNAGTQTLTHVIRGMGVGTISIANAVDVLKKELLVGGLNGLIWSIVVALISIYWYQNIELAIIVAVAMLVNIIVSVGSGVGLPILLNKLGVDPALAGGVALTTITDVVGFLAILGFAALVLV